MIYKSSIISFSGLDGSGKTTYAAKLYKYLNYNKERVILLNVYQMSLILNIGKLFEFIKVRQKKGISSETEKEGYTRTAFRCVAFFFDIFVFVTFVSILRFLGTYIICDRYLYDTLAHILQKGRLPEKVVDFYMSIIPAPEIAFLLFVDADKAIFRENAHASIGYFHEKKRVYDMLKNKAVFDVLETTGSLEASWTAMKNKVDEKLIIR